MAWCPQLGFFFFIVVDNCAEVVSEIHSFFFAYISYNSQMEIFDDTVHQGENRCQPYWIIRVIKMQKALRYSKLQFYSYFVTLYLLISSLLKEVPKIYLKLLFISCTFSFICWFVSFNN